MFDTLEERIKHETPGNERFAKGASMVVLSVLLFGGLY